MHSGTASMATTSLPEKTVWPTEKLTSKGDGKLCGGVVMSKARGSRKPSPPSRLDTPMVTTVRISRGAVKNRRMSRNSMVAPRATAARSPTGTARKYGMPGPTMRSTAREAGRAPSSPAEKLMIRFDL